MFQTLRKLLNAARVRESILEHQLNAHRHFRKDCAACLAGGLKGRKHMSQNEAELFCLSADIAGPLALTTTKNRFLVVSTHVA